jgi:hypothetical protein
VRVLVLLLFSSFSFAFSTQTDNVNKLNTKDIDFNNLEFVLSKKRITPKPQTNTKIIYKYLPIYYPVKVPVYYPVYIPKYIPVEGLKNIQ